MLALMVSRSTFFVFDGSLRFRKPPTFNVSMHFQNIIYYDLVFLCGYCGDTS